MEVLIARAPLRISFGGGGTDLAAYYRQYGGLVVSTAINKYCYTMVSLDETNDLQIISADFASFHRQPVVEDLVWNGNLGLPRAVVHHFGPRRGLNIFLASEVPPGTGLGSSSAVAVAMIKALSTLHGDSLSGESLAEMAAYIEIEKLGLPIGKQDQYASAYGGLNVITFSENSVSVEPLDLSSPVLENLQRNLLLFFTGMSRQSSTILRHQRQSTEDNAEVVIDSLHGIKRLAVDMAEALQSGRLEDFAVLLDESWRRKKRLAPNISNSFIDECYTLAQANGALGGKITGAGGGGFLMLYCPEEHQGKLTRLLEGQGLLKMDFRFERQGAQVLLNDLRLHKGKSADEEHLALSG